jgi:membrane fusion protein, copper/silver efflux system
MKHIHFALIVLSLIGPASFVGCSRPGAAIAQKPSDVDYYTCTMHPSVRSQDPDGKCPICGMDLVPVKKVDANAMQPASIESDKPRIFTIPVDRQQLIGVTYATVETKPLIRTIRAVGTVAAMTNRHWDYVARVDGYIHNLYVAAPGDRVEKGMVLMDLYSPDLVATENEYADLIRMRANGRGDKDAPAVQNAERLIDAARARLQQWNISDAEIDALEKSGAPEQYLPLKSPFDGFVEEVAVHQGRHVAAGDHLVDIVDLSSVWVWAEFYENEMPFLKPGLAVMVSSSSVPGLSIPGKVAVVDPFLNDAKRTGRVRIDVDNADSKLRPDAYVDVALTLDEGEGLTIPLESVLPTGEHNIVFVDKGDGRLEPRFVQLGGKYGDFFRVTEGLKAGERVVSSANFLVDAESKVQGALKSW